ncbi:MULTISPECIES: hypothetical protein [unclassified Streptomyces]|uniref:hypothetical protein n=1 Tax=Streptomyces TaxID=1883 RepID=UPI0019D27C44|nr:MULTISPECIES: hypothetical protein [unclassified Streptomyces]UQA37904.1 hypothetical protein KRR37_05355 [Streptomyces sp. HNA39]
MSLPGADELFRTTGGGMGLQSSSPADRRRKANGEPRVPAPTGESDAAARAETGEEHASADADDTRARGGEGDRRTAAAAPAAPASAPAGERTAAAAPAEQPPAVQQQRRRGTGRGANRRPSGRERHDEKITVYVSAEELMDLEHARLVLRGEHGLAVDRGRIVREAVAVVLADLESRGDASILVRRLRGR